MVRPPQALIPPNTLNLTVWFIPSKQKLEYVSLRNFSLEQPTGTICEQQSNEKTRTPYGHL